MSNEHGYGKNEKDLVSAEPKPKGRSCQDLWRECRDFTLVRREKPRQLCGPM